MHTESAFTRDDLDWGLERTCLKSLEMKSGPASWDASAEGAVRATADRVSAVLVCTSGDCCRKVELNGQHFELMKHRVAFVVMSCPIEEKPRYEPTGHQENKTNAKQGKDVTKQRQKISWAPE